MVNLRILQELKTKKITEISEIEKVIKCPCGNGEMKLRMIHVIPRNGKVSLSYGKCSASFCSYERGLIKFTYIIIPEFILGD